MWAETPTQGIPDTDTPDGGSESSLKVIRLAERAQTGPGSELEMVEPSDGVTEGGSSHAPGEHPRRSVCWR
jgi:hypothetical protein